MGQLRGGDLRNQHYGSSLLDELLVRDDLSRTYGDKVVVSRPRTVDGARRQPSGAAACEAYA